MGVQEEIKSIEDELAKTIYNKATQGHIGRLKAKLARLKETSQRKSGTSVGLTYGVKKQGDATVVMVGFPSVGKSTLLNAMTNAQSKVAAYEFTTLEVVPGMLEYRGARIQLLDIPGIIEDAAFGKGRGREVLSIVRIADLVLFVLAGPNHEQQRTILEQELYEVGIRINKRPPDVLIHRMQGGGIHVELPTKSPISKENVKDVLKEFKILNAEVLIRDRISVDQFIDCLEGNKVYIPALYILNKAETMPPQSKYIPISAMHKHGLEILREKVWSTMGMKRIYMKKPGKQPDMEEPFIMMGTLTVRDISEKIHLQGKEARIWGPSAKFPGQRVGMEHKLQDKDIVEIHST